MKNRTPRLTALAHTTTSIVKKNKNKNKKHTLFVKSKGPSPPCDGLLKFTFMLGGKNNYYQLNCKLRYK